MLETILIVVLMLSALSFALAMLAIGVAFYCGWFTLPYPSPDKVRSKVPQPPA
jgi:hypothetical protein